jgi:hypothetical protein
MKRIGLLALIFAVVSVGVVFAYDNDEADFDSMPKNTITVDFGPMLVSLGYVKFMQTIGSGDDSSNFPSFGIGAQYERQLLEKLSVGFRFAYLSFGMGMDDAEEGYKLSTEFSSFSLEGHLRFYPSDEIYFMGLMLGYGNLSVNSFGTDKDGKNVSIKTPRDYFKFGGKFGWRITFGDNGGFVFEPSMGWYGGLGLGKPLGGDNKGLNAMFQLLEDWVFIGGPRFCLSFGWRF